MAKEKVTPPTGDVEKEELNPALIAPETQNPPAPDPSKSDDAETDKAAEAERIKTEKAEADKAAEAEDKKKAAEEKAAEAERIKTEKAEADKAAAKKVAKENAPFAEIAQLYAKHYPHCDAFHITTDRQVFLSADKAEAEVHQLEIGVGKVRTINVK